MSNSNIAIRNKLYDFIRVADDKKLHAIYNLLQNEIDDRYQSLENGTDRGYTLDELEASVSKLRKKRYG